MGDSLIKEKIIDAAIQLFNSRGYDSVSLRDIAKDLQISSGNITYHFKKKNDIIDAIIEKMSNEYSADIYHENITIEEFNETLISIIDYQKKYYFFFYNITELSRISPQIAEMQVKVRQKRYGEYVKIFDDFVKQGVMRRELKTGFYENLSFAILSIIMYWIQQSSLEGDSISQQKNVLSILWSVLLPNMTEKGIQLFNEHHFY